MTLRKKYLLQLLLLMALVSPRATCCLAYEPPIEDEHAATAVQDLGLDDLPTDEKQAIQETTGVDQSGHSVPTADKKGLLIHANFNPPYGKPLFVHVDIDMTVGCVLPNLESVGTEIDFGVDVAVEDARLFGEEISNNSVVAVIFKKRLVGADDFGVLVEPLPDAGTEPDNSFHAVGRQKRIAENRVGLLADAIHAASPLYEADDRPGEIEVYDDSGVLQVLTFTQAVFL